MTNLTSLLTNLTELKMDVLTSNQMSNLKGGCGSSYGGGKSGKKNKSGHRHSGHGHSGHGGGYGCGCGCGCHG